MVEGDYGEVVLKIDDEEAHGDFLLLREMAHDLGAYNAVGILTRLKLIQSDNVIVIFCFCS